MSAIINAIKDRYSCRNFSAEPLNDIEIKALTECALASPSALNRMPWHIVVVTNKTLIEDLDKEAMKVMETWEDKTILERMKERGGSVFYNAPCLIYILSDGTEYATLDCGIVSQNIALAAHGLGLGSVICGMANIPLTGGRKDEFIKHLQFPQNFTFGMAVCVGKALSGKEPHELDNTKVTYITG